MYIYILILSTKSWVCLGIQGHTPTAAHGKTAEVERRSEGKTAEVDMDSIEWVANQRHAVIWKSLLPFEKGIIQEPQWLHFFTLLQRNKDQKNMMSEAASLGYGAALIYTVKVWRVSRHVMRDHSFGRSNFYGDLKT